MTTLLTYFVFVGLMALYFLRKIRRRRTIIKILYTPYARPGILEHNSF